MSLKYTKNGSPVSGATVMWSTSGGKLSSASTQTGTAGGTTVKLTSESEGQAVVTATVNGIEKKSVAIMFEADE